MTDGIRIGERLVGSGHPVYIVFEAGPTHDGLSMAKKLADMAADAGADAIKFQILDADKLVSSHEALFSYERLVDRESNGTETVTEPLLDILRRRELKREEWAELIDYCQSRGVEFFSTATNAEELEFLASHGVKTVKVCSGDVTYHKFLRETAQYNWSVQVDTGSATLGEVEQAVGVLEDAGCAKIIINHCPSGYPARLESINLRILSTLQTMFAYPIAFSDHSSGCDMDIAAVALGANIIEKTITLDKTTRSPEHIMSLEPAEGQNFVRRIRELEVALGGSRKKMSPSERQGQMVARRSLFAGKDAPAGTVLTTDMIRYSRPDNGIPADQDHLILGRTLRKPVKDGDILDISHVE